MNSFLGDETGIKLWSRATQPSDWPYAKIRNTESKNYWIASNSFLNNHIAYDLMGTDSAAFSGNKKDNVQTVFKKGARLSEIDMSRDNDSLELDYQTDKRLTPIKYKTIPDQNFPEGIKEIRITPWGPYDFRYPLLWLTDIDSNQLYHFEVLGPKGKWTTKSLEGFEIVSISSDSLPATMIAKIDSNMVQPTINLQYTGAATTNILGKQTAANTPQTFKYQVFQPKTNWQIQYFQWDSLSHPEKQLSSFFKLLETTPLKSFQSKELNFIWWGKLGDQLPADSFATVATTIIDFPKGMYQIDITADDLVKLFMDGKEIMNAWESNATTYDESTHHKIQLPINGKHQFKIIQADYSGLATLQFHIQPVSFLTSY
jgi:PA14 domain